MSKLPTTSRRFTKTPEVATTSLSRRIRGPGGCPLTFVGDFKRRSVFDGRKDKPLLGPPGREVQERPQAPPYRTVSSGGRVLRMANWHTSFSSWLSKKNSGPVATDGGGAEDCDIGRARRLAATPWSKKISKLTSDGVPHSVTHRKVIFSFEVGGDFLE